MPRRPLIPEPQAIDPISGFKVPWKNLVRQWDGEMVDYRYADKRNPQDFVRGIPDSRPLPYARPEPPEIYIAGNILWEDGRPMIGADGSALLTEGEIVTL
jgi:hypothetical protein